MAALATHPLPQGGGRGGGIKGKGRSARLGGSRQRTIPSGRDLTDLRESSPAAVRPQGASSHVLQKAERFEGVQIV